MAEQELDSTDVGALLEEVNGKCVAGHGAECGPLWFG